MVPVVHQVAVSKQLTRADQVVELPNRVLRVLALAAVHVAEEDAGVAIGAEEDERVREGLEPRRHPVLERLANLRVVLRSASLLFHGWASRLEAVDARCRRECWSVS